MICDSSSFQKKFQQNSTECLYAALSFSQTHPNQAFLLTTSQKRCCQVTDDLIAAQSKGSFLFSPSTAHL